MLHFRRSSNGPKSLQLSCLSTKNHGLHKLSLCRACQRLSVSSMCAPEGCLYHKNLWSLLNTQQECRFCAFLAQTISPTRASCLINFLVNSNSVFDYKYTIYLNLANGRLNVKLGRHGVVANIELYCDPSMKCKLVGRAELSAKNGHRRLIC